MNDRGKLNLDALREAGGFIFWLPGHPLARNSGIHQTHKNKLQAKYQEDVGWAAKAAISTRTSEWRTRHIPMNGPIALGVTVFRKWPATNKPDLDNYVKLVCDAMTGARIFHDDAQVVEFLPGTRKVESQLEGMRIILIPQGRLEALGFGGSDL